MSRKRTATSQQRADRALCEASVPGVFGVKLHVVAGYLQRRGISEKLTGKQAKAWRDNPAAAPEWFIGLLADIAADKARREHAQQREDLEYEHRLLVLAEKVEQRLLSGAKHFRNPDAEFIASDVAFRAMKDLVRCGGDISWLGELDMAALRWVGVNPADHDTWFIHGGDCCR